MAVLFSRQTSNDMLWLVWLMFSENLTQNLKESPTFFFDVSTPKDPSERALLFLEQDKYFFFIKFAAFSKNRYDWGRKILVYSSNYNYFF